MSLLILVTIARRVGYFDGYIAIIVHISTQKGPRISGLVANIA